MKADLSSALSGENGNVEEMQSISVTSLKHDLERYSVAATPGFRYQTQVYLIEKVIY